MTLPVSTSLEKNLSARDIEVLQRVADGNTNKQAAHALHISEATVKTHLLHIFEKLGSTTGHLPSPKPSSAASSGWGIDPNSRSDQAARSRTSGFPQTLDDDCPGDLRNLCLFRFQCEQRRLY